jgi:hypothetical protein
MADNRQSKQENTSHELGGAGQTIVSLQGVNEGGLTFFSRHRFEVASEIQMRVRWDVLPNSLRARLVPDKSGWISVRGFVIECRAERQSNGAAVFRVSLVLDVVLLKRATTRALAGADSSGRGQRDLFGLN